MIGGAAVTEAVRASARELLSASTGTREAAAPARPSGTRKGNRKRKAKAKVGGESKASGHGKEVSHRDVRLPDERPRLGADGRPARPGGLRADRRTTATRTSSSSTPAACASTPRRSSIRVSASCASCAEETGRRPRRRRRRLRRAAGRRRAAQEDQRPRDRRRPRHAAAEDAADARRAGGRSRRSPKSISAPLGRRDVSARHHASRAIRSRRTSRSSRGATTTARSAWCPYTRGHERMRAKADILADVREAVASGRKEIQLLGQIVNHYQAPDDPACDFAQLLAEVNDVPGVERIRFASPHPRHTGAAARSTRFATCRKVCKHVHLPVQSGSTRVLAGHAAAAHPRGVSRPASTRSARPSRA